jgi:NhaA family Na+:H+ antiporter
MSAARPIRRVGTRIQSAFQDFFQASSSAGIVIICFTAIAMVWINSPLGASYLDFLHQNLEITISGLHLHFTFEHFVNDALMVVFFLVVGLEIKREMLIGELSSVKRAMLPMVGAVFGMVFPAAIYAVLNAGTPAVRGWGVPVATDIAFALGFLALLGNRVPLGLKVFLAALAIVDDLLSVLVIAVFYTNDLNLLMLVWAGIVTTVLYAGNRLGIHNIKFYVIGGILLWFFVLQSGVHATIAGVVLALTIPVNRKMERQKFFRNVHDMVVDTMRTPEDVRRDADESDVIHALEKMSERVQSPLARIEHGLQPYVAFLIMPIFALANSGVAVSESMVEGLTSNLSLGIILGLFVGKQVGITLAAWLSLRLGWAELPANTTLKHVYGVSLLCGIGFTMALFVAHLAFIDHENLQAAKLSILLGSTISAIGGFMYLRRTLPAAPSTAP